jgi:hypothetical protein
MQIFECGPPIRGGFSIFHFPISIFHSRAKWKIKNGKWEMANELLPRRGHSFGAKFPNEPRSLFATQRELRSRQEPEFHKFLLCGLSAHSLKQIVQTDKARFMNVAESRPGHIGPLRGQSIDSTAGLN